MPGPRRQLLSVSEMRSALRCALSCVSGLGCLNLALRAMHSFVMAPPSMLAKRVEQYYAEFLKDESWQAAKQCVRSVSFARPLSRLLSLACCLSCWCGCRYIHLRAGSKRGLGSMHCEQHLVSSLPAHPLLLADVLPEF